MTNGKAYAKNSAWPIGNAQGKVTTAFPRSLIPVKSVRIEEHHQQSASQSCFVFPSNDPTSLRLYLGCLGVGRGPGPGEEQGVERSGPPKSPRASESHGWGFSKF